MRQHQEHKQEQYQYGEDEDISKYIGTFAIRDIGTVIATVTIILTLFYIVGIKSSITSMIVTILIGFLLSFMGVWRPELVIVYGPYSEIRAYLRTLCIFIISAFVLPSATPTPEVGPVKKIEKGASVQTHTMTTAEMTDRIAEIMANWPTFMESGTQGYDRDYVHGILIIIFASGYQCDTFSSISSTQDSVYVRCNHDKYGYVLTSSSGGLPVARPAE